MTDYTLENNQVLRNGQPLANYNPETQTLDFLPDCAQFRAAVVRWLRANGHEVEPAAMRRPSSEPPPIPPEATSKAAGNAIASTDYPDAPPLDPMLGDKTPAFVEWLRDNHPEAFAKRYAARKTHLT